MNQKTAKLLKKYATKHDVNYRKLKAAWTNLPHAERGKRRVLIQQDLGLEKAKKP